MSTNINLAWISDGIHLTRLEIGEGAYPRKIKPATFCFVELLALTHDIDMSLE